MFFSFLTLSGGYLTNFYVGVTDDAAVAQAPSTTPVNYEVCYFHENAVDQARRVRMVCDSPLTGRYVIIQVTGTANLHITEVEVYSGKKISGALLFFAVFP